MQTIDINGKQVDLSQIIDLIGQNKKIEAIKILKDNTDIGLKDAKDLIESLESSGIGSEHPPVSFSRTESVTTRKTGDEVTVSYTDENGEKSIVTPNDPSWGKVKNIARDNATIDAYEKNYSSSSQSINNGSVFIEEKRSNTTRYIIIAIIAAILAYFVFR